MQNPPLRLARRFRGVRIAFFVAMGLVLAELLIRVVTLIAFYVPLMRHPELLERFQRNGQLPLDAESARAILVPEHFPWMSVQGAGPSMVITWKTFGDIGTADFRGYPADPDARSGVVRIAFVGGSTTLEGYPEEAGRLFDQALGPGRVQIVNLGQNGSMSLTDEYLMRKFLPALKPDLTVFYEGFNDLEAYGIRSMLLANEAARRPAGTDAARGLTDDPTGFCRIQRSTGLAELLGRALGLRRPGLASCHERFTSGLDPFACDGSDLCQALDPFTAYRRMVELARSAGSLPVLSTFAAPDYGNLPTADLEYFDDEIIYLWPFLGNVTTYSAMLAKNNEVVRALAAETATPLVDVAHGLVGGRQLFKDNCHRTTEGVRRHGQLVFDALLPTVRSLLAGPAARR